MVISPPKYPLKAKIAVFGCDKVRYLYYPSSARLKAKLAGI